ncbi:MAG: hypothetical protein IJ040_07205 [Lachnospiraceae bacterium]|nr:hypothetical protein [Lachnospiraceae bacterium]
MKRTMKQAVAILLSVMCLSLTGCGGAKTPEACKDWDEGVMSINGGIVVIGKTNIDDFMAATGFDEVVELSEYSDTSYYYLSDGYSEIQVAADENGTVYNFFASDYYMDEDNLDLEHTTIVGPGGITVGSSTVEDVAAYDANIKDRYSGSIDDDEDYGICSYIAGKKKGDFDLVDGFLYSVIGDYETRIVYEMSLTIEN